MHGQQFNTIQQAGANPKYAQGNFRGHNEVLSTYNSEDLNNNNLVSNEDGAILFRGSDMSLAQSDLMQGPP